MEAQQLPHVDRGVTAGIYTAGTETARWIPFKLGRPLEAGRPQVNAKFRPDPLGGCLLSTKFQNGSPTLTVESRALRCPYAIREGEQLSAGYYAGSGRQALTRHP